MSHRTTHLMLASAVLTGCATVETKSLRLPPETNRAEVVAFREWAFNAGGVSVAFGADSDPFVVLRNSQYASVYLEPKVYQFFVRAGQADPGVIQTVLKPGDRKCLRVSPDPANLAKAAIPIILMASGYGFLVQEAACPSAAELAKYGRVEVQYRTD